MCLNAWMKILDWHETKLKGLECFSELKREDYKWTNIPKVIQPHPSLTASENDNFQEIQAPTRFSLDCRVTPRHWVSLSVNTLRDGEATVALFVKWEKNIVKVPAGHRNFASTAANNVLGLSFPQGCYCTSLCANHYKDLFYFLTIDFVFPRFNLNNSHFLHFSQSIPSSQAIWGCARQTNGRLLSIRGSSSSKS